jgi:hypothetical protein
MNSPPVLVLVPLDDRPVTGRLPVMVAAVAGAAVRIPPARLLPEFRRPGDMDGLSAWLRQAAATADAAVVSLEMLAMGGLVPSRIGQESAASTLARWDVLSELDLPVHASAVVTRTPNADDASEEPLYFAHSGRAVHAASAALSEGRPLPDGIDTGALADFLQRRLRNHVLNLSALGLAHRGTVTTLAITSDDTAVAGIGTAEQEWIERWVRWLTLTDRVLMYPGADEVGTVLIARALTSLAGGPAPTVRVHATGGLDRIPPYENAPIGQSAHTQVLAAGGRPFDAPADEPADLELVLHPPSLDGHDHAVNPPTKTDPAAAQATADLVRELLSAGRTVALADCAHPNGADPALVRALGVVLGRRWERLAGFAAWNTAGNSIGTAVAHGLAGVAGRRLGTFDADAHAHLIRHRLLEDWGWMTHARGDVRKQLALDPTRHDQLAPDSAAKGMATALLQDRLAELGPGWAVRDVRFPWGRTFEIDFIVEPA